MTEKIGIYIDGANIYYGLKGRRIDFKQFYAWLAEGREIAQACYFNASRKENQNMQKFFAHVKNSGFKTYIKQTTLNSQTGQYKQAGIDVFLSVKALRQNRDWQTLVLVSGDYDYLPLVDEIVNGFGKKVEIVSFKYALHPIYQRFKVKFMDDYLDLMEGKDGGGRPVNPTQESQ